jgi:hypothetical protein
MKFQRIYHKWDTWEEVAYNMWGNVEDKQKAILQAVEFTGDHKKYGSFMRRVIEEWPVSCENALTDYGINRKAWLGHAACALAMQIPEDIIRAAWGKLTSEQQYMANKEAERAIQAWEYAHFKNSVIRGDMEMQVLL